MSPIPAELRERDQWVIWRYKTRDGKRTKVPYQAAKPRTEAEVDDPSTWSSFEHAAAVKGVDGIGYVFSADDPYTGVDLDHCINADTGEVHPAAAAIVERLASYTERSPSGTGLHVIVAAELHGDRHRTSKTPWDGVFEVYDRGRYFTMTATGPGRSTTARSSSTPWSPRSSRRRRPVKDRHRGQTVASSMPMTQNCCAGRSLPATARECRRSTTATPAATATTTPSRSRAMRPSGVLDRTGSRPYRRAVSPLRFVPREVGAGGLPQPDD